MIGSGIGVGPTSGVHGNGNNFRGSGNVEKMYGSKSPFAIRFFILFMYLNFKNAPEIVAFPASVLLTVLYYIVKQQLTSDEVNTVHEEIYDR